MYLIFLNESKLLLPLNILSYLILVKGIKY